LSAPFLLFLKTNTSIPSQSVRGDETYISHAPLAIVFSDV
jgi:hypothetical protein